MTPALIPDEAGRLPHVYGDGSLCLAEGHDWRPDRLFVDTFLPWACEWLVYYEVWRGCGRWFGDAATGDTKNIMHAYRQPRGSNQAHGRTARSRLGYSGS